MLALREAQQSEWPKVKVHFTITPYNTDDIPGYYAYFKKRFPSLDMIKFHFPRFVTPAMSDEYIRVMRDEFGTDATSHLGNFSDAEAYATIDCDQIYESVTDILSRPKSSVTGPVTREGIEQYFRQPGTPPPGSRCACFKSLTVQPDGSVVNCADFPDLVYGNINDASLDEIWTGDTATRWRAYLA